MQEIQLAGLLLRGPFPDLHMHRAISIFEIQFAGATTTNTKEKVLLGKWSAIAMLELQRSFQISIEQSRFSKFSLQVLQPLPDIQKGIFEIQLAGNSACRVTVERSFPRSPYA